MSCQWCITFPYAAALWCREHRQEDRDHIFLNWLVLKRLVDWYINQHTENSGGKNGSLRDLVRICFFSSAVLRCHHQAVRRCDGCFAHGHTYWFHQFHSLLLLKFCRFGHFSLIFELLWYSSRRLHMFVLDFLCVCAFYFENWSDSLCYSCVWLPALCSWMQLRSKTD